MEREPSAAPPCDVGSWGKAHGPWSLDRGQAGGARGRWCLRLGPWASLAMEADTWT